MTTVKYLVLSYSCEYLILFSNNDSFDWIDEPDEELIDYTVKI